ncbi:TcdA/TcdB pore-forming domain-containing protein, partial [Providencia alcalifaciens]|uniref:TcdA/TcdB pore-forming domain-containing protein n=1 Tax=Providencia alcalifaciens TaxID=126385 RepID=UPI002B053397
TRHDSGFDVIRRLEENDDFDYDFYIFPSENTITQIYQEYVNTTIEVKLDHHNRHLVVPKLASEWHGKINYSIRGDGGQYKISLQYGIGVKLFDDASHKISHDEYSLWVIDIGQLNTELITVQKNGLNINGVVVEVDNSAMNGYMFILDKNNE